MSRRVRPETWVRVSRDAALIEQNGRCCWCRCKLERKTATAEHKEPKSKGGLDRRENIAAACAPCNLARGSRSAKVFMEMLRGTRRAPTFRIALAAARYRINRRADEAVARILKFAGLAPAPKLPAVSSRARDVGRAQSA